MFLRVIVVRAHCSCALLMGVNVYTSRRLKLFILPLVFNDTFR